MKQSINLYKPEFRKKSDALSVAAMGRWLLVAAVLLGGVSAFDYWRSWQLSGQLADAQQQRQEAIARTEDLIDRFGVQSENPELTEEVRELEDSLAAKQNLVSFLEGRELGNTAGFSEHMAELARYHVDGLQITGLDLLGGGETVFIRGRVRGADTVPLFLRNLSRGGVYAGKTFETLRIGGSDGTAATLPFEVATGNR